MSMAATPFAMLMTPATMTMSSGCAAPAGRTTLATALRLLSSAGGAAAAAAGGGGGGGAAPMEVDEGTVGAQALGMLPGVEALEEDGDREGETKMGKA